MHKIKASMVTDDNYPHSNNSSVDNFNYDINLIGPGNTPNSNTTQHSPGHAFTKLIINQNLKRFSGNFNGTPFLIIESRNTITGIGFWHQLKCVKVVCNNFFGVNDVKSNEHKIIPFFQ